MKVFYQRPSKNHMLYVYNATGESDNYNINVALFTSATWHNHDEWLLLDNTAYSRHTGRYRGTWTKLCDVASTWMLYC